MTQAEFNLMGCSHLELRTGISKSHWSMVFHGKRLITPDFLTKAAAPLNLTPKRLRQLCLERCKQMAALKTEISKSRVLAALAALALIMPANW